MRKSAVILGVAELALVISMAACLLPVVGFLPARVSLTSWEKISLALYIALALTGVFLPLASLPKTTKRFFPLAALISGIATLSSVPVLPLTIGRFSAEASLIAITGAILMLYLAFSERGLLAEALKISWTSWEIAVTSVFSALTAVLTAYVGAIFPSPTGGYTHIGDSAIFIAALLFGPKVGATVGVVGPLVADMVLGYPRWYVSILAHGVEGLLAGMARDRGLGYTIAALILAGLFMASTYFIVNVFIKGYAPALMSLVRDLFGQAGVSAVIALIAYKPVKRAIGRR